MDPSRDINKAVITEAGGLSVLATLIFSMLHPSVHTELRLHEWFQQRQDFLYFRFRIILGT